jgi:hypothetical protein
MMVDGLRIAEHPMVVALAVTPLVSSRSATSPAQIWVVNRLPAERCGMSMPQSRLLMSEMTTHKGAFAKGSGAIGAPWLTQQSVQAAAHGLRGRPAHVCRSHPCNDQGYSPTRLRLV